MVKEVECPPQRPLESDRLWTGENGGPNLEVLRDWFFREGRLSKEDVIKMNEMATGVLREEKNLLHVEGSVTVCGDIHGQFYDLVKLFEVGGDPRSTIYLFLGDYVDRGHFGLECALYLMAHKILYPDNFFLLRGNHECRHLTAYFNFKEECLYKMDEDVYDHIMNTFDHLPLAAIVNQKFLAVHGGLSPEITEYAQIDDLDRFQEPPPQGGMCDILWSDPVEDESDASEMVTYIPNTTRGCSFFFGHEAVRQFLEENHLLSILRAHEAQLDGYKMHRKRQGTDFPSVITLFSAPNYCDIYANKGAILKYHDNLMNIRQFNCSPHPYHLPNFMNVFQWSMPFVADKIAEFCLSIVNSVSAEEDQEMENQLADAKKKPEPVGKPKVNASVIKNKIKAAAKFSLMLQSLRDNSEEILRIKKEMPDNKIPPGLLQKGQAEIRRVIDSFDKARKVDILNERRPSEDDLFKNMGPRSRRASLQKGEMSAAVANFKLP